ncbi:hypothetical protein JCM13580A_42360 [Streptomyces drozdowiczii]
MVPIDVRAFLRGGNLRAVHDDERLHSILTKNQSGVVVDGEVAERMRLRGGCETRQGGGCCCDEDQSGKDT